MSGGGRGKLPTLKVNGEPGMSDTQTLLNRITALRQRLDEAAGGSSRGDRSNPAHGLRQKVVQGGEDGALLDAAMRQLPETAAWGEDQVLPTRLTGRARRILDQGRELLSRLRDLDDEFHLAAAPAEDPQGRMYREVASMTNTTLRMLQALPDAPSVQLRLCEGLEAILGLIAQRLATVTVLAKRQQHEVERMDHLSGLLTSLSDERSYEVKPFVRLAEAILEAVQQGAVLRFSSADPGQPARWVACHSLNVAQVIARVVRHDPELRARPLEAVLAALIHDVGMVRVPTELLARPGPLNGEERRVIERHCRSGADLACRLLPSGTWLAEATVGHHERLDGTGYPNGLRELQIPTLTRLLAVCDIYAALRAPRSYRPAIEARTALTDTLLMAEQGILDRYQAEHLLQLSFYPSGTVVELAEGTVAVVLATHPTYRDLNVPARPFLALLTDTKGRPLAVPRYVDLAQVDGHGIVRTLSPEERRQVLGLRYPEFV
jgi:HD-GYP domain-containing protein (c-di-GMP phosphodiesterase class II)